jgi:hypothetical protein
VAFLNYIILKFKNRKNQSCLDNVSVPFAPFASGALSPGSLSPPEDAHGGEKRARRKITTSVARTRIKSSFCTFSRRAPCFAAWIVFIFFTLIAGSTNAKTTARVVAIEPRALVFVFFEMRELFTAASLLLRRYIRFRLACLFYLIHLLITALCNTCLITTNT